MPYQLAIDPTAEKEWARLDKSVKTILAVTSRDDVYDVLANRLKK